jgi:hypothetical protein
MTNEREGPTASYKLSEKLSLRYHRLKFKASGILPIILEESMEYTLRE